MISHTQPILVLHERTDIADKLFNMMAMLIDSYDPVWKFVQDDQVQKSGNILSPLSTFTIYAVTPVALTQNDVNRCADRWRNVLAGFYESDEIMEMKGVNPITEPDTKETAIDDIFTDIEGMEGFDFFEPLQGDGDPDNY